MGTLFPLPMLSPVAFVNHPRVQTSSANPLYLYAHFRDDDAQHLRLSYSTDQTASWKDINTQGSLTAAQLRDPSVLYVPNANPLLSGTFYFLATPAVGVQVQFFTSTDLVNFSAIRTINMAAYVEGATLAWAPEWWHDPNSDLDYFFVAISTSRRAGSNPFAPIAPYLVQFDPAAGALIGTPLPVSLSGATQGRTFDYFPYYDGLQYYLFYVDQQPLSAVTQPIAYATAASIAGPYYQQTTQGFDYFGLGTLQAEAPTLIRLGGMGCIRLIYDAWTIPVGKVLNTSFGRRYAPFYRDSCLAAGPPFSAESFAGGPLPLAIGRSEHGTIIALTDDISAAVVFNAAAQFDVPPTPLFPPGFHRASRFRPNSRHALKPSSTAKV